VVDFVTSWCQKTGIPAERWIGWIGIQKPKFYDWKQRYGKVNEHNSWIPRDNWLTLLEKAAILDFFDKHPTEGYRRLTYMMNDAAIVAASPTTVWRVLRAGGRLDRWNQKHSKKGTGFVQPLQPHEHWHTDIAYINVAGTFYYLCTVLDGCSRYIVSWDLREQLTTTELEIIIEKGREAFPNVKPRVISDNGPQFISSDFKQYIRLTGMSHVRISPYYPQSNGKIERYHRTIKSDTIRVTPPSTYEEAKRQITKFVAYYNEERLHSALNYVTPADRLAGRQDAIQAARQARLEAARERRAQARALGRAQGRAPTHQAGPPQSSSSLHLPVAAQL
jgi:transposase InsO family protein